MSRKTVTLQRSYQADLDDVWEMWTTKDGIESWWGPDGFKVTVQRIDLEPGGKLLYTMTAVRQQEIDFMKKSGMPLSQEHLITYVEIIRPRLLRYTNLVDFVPGTPPYDADTKIELEAAGSAVKLTLTIEAMHDERWTQMAVMGWESELGKLEKSLQQALKGATP